MLIDDSSLRKRLSVPPICHPQRRATITARVHWGHVSAECCQENRSSMAVNDSNERSERRRRRPLQFQPKKRRNHLTSNGKAQSLFHQSNPINRNRIKRSMMSYVVLKAHYVSAWLLSSVFVFLPDRVISCSLRSDARLREIGEVSSGLEAFSVPVFS